MAEIRALTGLRGVAATTVFCAHMRETLMAQGLDLNVPEWVVRLFLSGGRQVDIFFVLSGFILTMNYRAWFAESVRLATYLKFMRRRMARIYPLHCTMLLLIIGAVIAARLTGAATSYGLARFDFSTLPAHFLLMHAWGVFFEGAGEWNPPSWSISIEALAYLVFPFIIWAWARQRVARPWVPIVLIALTGLGLNAFFHWGISGLDGISRGLTGFTLGCFVFGLYDSGTSRWLQTRTGSLLAPLLLAASYLVVPDTAFVIALFSAPLLLTLCDDKNPISRFFGWGPVFFLGEISYSIYLGHFLLSSIAYRITRVSWMKMSPLHSAIGIAFVIAFVVGVSTLLYYFVEKPGRSFLSGRRSVAAAV